MKRFNLNFEKMFFVTRKTFCRNYFKFSRRILRIDFCLLDLIQQIKKIKILCTNTLYFIPNKIHLNHIDFIMYINNKFSVKQ